MSAMNTNSKIILGLVAIAGAYAVYELVIKKDSGVSGIGDTKSEAASQVLKLMDKDQSYSDALKKVVADHTKGESNNQKKKFKKKLSTELKNYI